MSLKHTANRHLRTGCKMNIYDVREPDLKEINFEGETFHRVGCRNCGGGGWLVFTDGKKRFIAYCFCGHKIEIAKNELTLSLMKSLYL